MVDRPEYEKLTKIIGELNASISSYRKALNALKEQIADWTTVDPVSSLYRDVFTKNRILPDPRDRDSFLSELKARYENQQPPGYKDKGKADGGVGDLLIWKSIIELGKDKEKNVVFVSNETKHDWVYRSKEQPLMPRVELLHEFHRCTGQHFGLVSWTRFLKLEGADDATVEQARRVESDDQTTWHEKMKPIRMHAVELLKNDISVLESDLADLVGEQDDENIVRKVSKALVQHDVCLHQFERSLVPLIPVWTSFSQVGKWIEQFMDVMALIRNELANMLKTNRGEWKFIQPLLQTYLRTLERLRGVMKVVFGSYSVDLKFA
jgi:hypothetical protein